MTRRLCAILLVAALGSACASTPRTRSFQDLPKYLEPGNTVNVTETTGATSSGRLEVLSPSSMTMLTKGNRREVSQDRW